MLVKEGRYGPYVTDGETNATLSSRAGDTPDNVTPERAAALLREIDLPIAEIATRTGFAHQAHLTRVTSKLLGASPKRIREGGVAAN